MSRKKLLIWIKTGDFGYKKRKYGDKKERYLN